MSVAVRGGTVVTVAGSRRAHVRIDAGRITHVGGDIPPADRDIDASGLLVLPGVVDLHTHLASTPSRVPLDTFESGTRAAIAGGVTTVLAMVYQEDGSLRRGVERGMRDAERSHADFAFHVVVTDPSTDAFGELSSLVRDGYAGLKVFMVMPQFAARLDDFLALYRAARDEGILVAVHAEDHARIAAATASLHAQGRTGVAAFPESRPVEAESRAVAQAVAHAAVTNAHLYLVHLSSAAAVETLAAGKRSGAPVHGETRPLYLYLTRERFDRPDGALWVGQPPLRDPSDVDAIWRALADGTLDTVGTDHYPHSRAAKLAPDLTFDRIPPGVSNLETLLPMLHSEGVRRGRITIERLVDVLATTPARLAGLATKGEIAVGKDADLVLFDPARTRTVRAAELHSACDYDPYEGWEVTGWPRLVLLRGEVAYDGEVRARPGDGRLTRRGAIALPT